MPQQDFTGNAKKAALVGTLTAAAGPGTVFAVGTGGGSGHPTGSLGLPWVETIDRGLPTEEKILCSLRNGDNFTISQRGYDGTAVVDHQNGGPVEHTIDAAHLRTMSAHVYDTTRDDHTQFLHVDGRRSATKLGIGGTVAAGLLLDVHGAARVGTAAHDLLQVDDLSSNTAGFLTVRQRLSVTAGGLDVVGSPSGYTGGELRFPAAGLGDVGISTTFTNNAFMNFDHRGVGNTGQWAWRNGTGAASRIMMLNSVGVLTLDPRSTNSSYSRFERNGVLYGLVGITKGAGDLMGGDSDTELIIRGDSGIRFGTGSNWGWMATNGNMAWNGDQHLFGANAQGAAGPRIRLYAPAGDPANTYVIGESSAAAVHLHVQSKGTSDVTLRSGNGTDQIRINDTGVGFYGQAPQARGVVAGSRGGNAALTSLINALNNIFLIQDTTTA